MRVVDFIVCDDIRHELGNKKSLMGIFSELVIVQGDIVWPIRMNLGIYARIAREHGEPMPDTVAMTVSCNGTQIGGANAEFGPSEAALLNFVVSMKPLVIPEAGALEFGLSVMRNGERAAHAVHALTVRADV